MIYDRVKVAVPAPGAVAQGSTVVVGAAPSGFRSPLAAAGPAGLLYLVLSDGAGRALTMEVTANNLVPESFTVNRILWNDRLASTAGETFAGACVAYCARPGLREYVEEPIAVTGAVAQLDIPIRASLKMFRITFRYVLSANAGLLLRVQRAGVGTFDAGASDYLGGYLGRGGSDTANTVQSDGGATGISSIPVAPTCLGNAGYNQVTIEMNAGESALYASLTATGMSRQSTQINGFAYFGTAQNAGRIVAVRLLPSTGNIALADGGLERVA